MCLVSGGLVGWLGGMPKYHRGSVLGQPTLESCDRSGCEGDEWDFYISVLPLEEEAARGLAAPKWRCDEIESS